MQSLLKCLILSVLTDLLKNNTNKKTSKIDEKKTRLFLISNKFNCFFVTTQIFFHYNTKQRKWKKKYKF